MACYFYRKFDSLAITLAYHNLNQTSSFIITRSNQTNKMEYTPWHVFDCNSLLNNMVKLGTYSLDGTTDRPVILSTQLIGLYSTIELRTTWKSTQRANTFCTHFNDYSIWLHYWFSVPIINMGHINGIIFLILSFWRKWAAKNCVK